MKRFHPREMALLLGPVVLLGIVGWWRSRLPAQVPKPKVRFEAQAKMQNAAPDMAFRGFDTHVELEGRFTEESLKPRNGVLVNDVRLIARDIQGRERRVWSLDKSEFSTKPVIVNDGNSGDRYSGSSLFHTRSRVQSLMLSRHRLTFPNHTLLLRGDYVWYPARNLGAGLDVSAGEIARLRELPGAHFKSVEIVVRRAGEKVPKPVVSTDPLFDVRQVRFTPKDQRVQLECDFHWRGPIQINSSELYARFQYEFVDNQGNGYISGLTGARTELLKGRRSYRVTIDFEFDKQMRADARKRGVTKLMLDTRLVVDNRWPRRLQIPLPNWVLSGKNKPQ